ncbi:hypothetical protein A9F13_15g00088 [Clavispora lusitaniae]|uniref:Uncharacterized protein n=1 Tax=Clavispora lusitaniae TaxID=36911 RepID=A0AA91PWK5_CLALS|nr:hypothetical protein A9F13_15g00088 [Clavispora lusitaniae]
MMRCAHYTPYVSEVAMGHAKKRARAIAYGKRSWGGQSNMSSEHQFVGSGLFLSCLACVCLSILATYSTARPELLVF